jgi:hypothetical protein
MPAADGLHLPVANCILCGWPMDGSVNILEVHVGIVAVYRACADECPPADVNRRRPVDRQRYIDQRQALARRVHRQMVKIDGRSLSDFRCIGELERRYSHLRGRNDPKQVEVNPSSAAGLSAAEIMKRVRDQSIVTSDW